MDVDSTAKWKYRLQGVALTLLAALVLFAVWLAIQIALGFAAIVHYG